jgi:hypothetical protein
MRQCAIVSGSIFRFQGAGVGGPRLDERQESVGRGGDGIGIDLAHAMVTVVPIVRVTDNR